MLVSPPCMAWCSAPLIIAISQSVCEHLAIIDTDEDPPGKIIESFRPNPNSKNCVLSCSFLANHCTCHMMTILCNMMMIMISLVFPSKRMIMWPHSLSQGCSRLDCSQIFFFFVHHSESHSRADQARSQGN